MRALITGMNGFAGSHLADFLLTQPDVEVFGGVYGHRDNIAHLTGSATFIEGDLNRLDFVEALLEQSKPDRIYHLAAQAFVPISWQDPWATIANNVRAQVNLLDAAARSKLQARILIIGSNEEYGRVDPRDLPITEKTSLRPDSPYGVSKIAQDYLGLQYFLSHQLPVVRVRPFNHIGPRQREQFAIANFAKQIAEIEAGMYESVLRVGNLSAARDFTDVRDMVRAYYLALERGMPGEVYNIGSGRAWSLQRIVDLMLQESRTPIRVEQDPARLRPSDTPTTYCNAAKFRAQTDWRPSIPLETSLRDILGYWRNRIGVKQQPA